MEFYRRQLPHWQPSGEKLFLTWRLADRYLDRALRGSVFLEREEIAIFGSRA